jgi:hypothetical protein
MMMVIPLTTVIVQAQAQSGFTDYSNQYLAMVYPSGWTVNETGFNSTIIPERSPGQSIIFTPLVMTQ